MADRQLKQEEKLRLVEAEELRLVNEAQVRLVEAEKLRLINEEQTRAINNGIAETIAHCSDEEIIAEINEDERGQQLLSEAADLRKKLFKAASQYPLKSQQSQPEKPASIDDSIESSIKPSIKSSIKSPIQWPIPLPQLSTPLPTAASTYSLTFSDSGLTLSDSRNILIRNTNPARAVASSPQSQWRRSIMPTLSPALAFTVIICSLLAYSYSYLENESANNWLKAAIINSRQNAINCNRSALPSTVDPAIKPSDSIKQKEERFNTRDTKLKKEHTKEEGR